MNDAQQIKDSKSNFFEEFSYKYFPYWPLFVFFIFFSLFGAWLYLRYTIPVYSVSATLLINDQKKGADETKIEESLNLLSSNKIVENEIEVLQSRKLMTGVVKDLNLYTPMYEEGKIMPVSAYVSSPIIIEAESKDSIEENFHIPYKYDSSSKTVIINNTRYHLNEFYNTPYGKFKFLPNENLLYTADRPLYFSVVQPNKIAGSILSSFFASATSKQSSIVNIYYKDEIPKRGENIVNRLMENYNNEAIDYKNNLAKNTIAFVDERLKIVSAELNDVEKKIQNYKARQGIVDLSEQGRQYLQNVGENDQKLQDVDLQLSALKQVETYVNSKDNSAGIVPSTLGVNDPTLTKLLDKLYQSELDYERLSKTTAENNPILLSISTEINRIRPSILENIRNQRSNLLLGKNNLTTTNRSYNSSLHGIPQQERELINVSREQTIKNNVYSFLLQKREETAMSYASNMANSKIVSPAQSSGGPTSPKTDLIYLVAIVLAFLVSMGAISFKELFTGKVLFRSQIEDLTEIPIIAEISSFHDKKSILFKGQNNRSIQEQFRQLRAAAGLYSKENLIKKILVTSSISGEGKSLVSANLALSLSRSGKRIVLVDADLRNPQFSKMFSTKLENGIAQFLENDLEPEQIIEQTEFNNLSIISAGETHSNPTELLLNGRFESLFQYLEENFDFIVIDTPPITPVTDAYIISEYCDITFYVVRHQYTPKTFIKKIDKNNKLKPLKNLAIVFNGIKPRGFIKGDFGYGYGYGYENKANEKYLIS